MVIVFFQGGTEFRFPLPKENISAEGNQREHTVHLSLTKFFETNAVIAFS